MRELTPAQEALWSHVSVPGRADTSHFYGLRKGDQSDEVYQIGMRLEKACPPLSAFPRLIRGSESEERILISQEPFDKVISKLVNPPSAYNQNPTN